MALGYCVFKCTINLLFPFLFIYKIFFFFFFFKNTKYFNIHTRRGENVLKKLTVVYIQNDITLEYTTQTLNLFNSHSFSNVRFFIDKSKYVIENKINKVYDSGVYLKEHNS